MITYVLKRYCRIGLLWSRARWRHFKVQLGIRNVGLNFIPQRKCQDFFINELNLSLFLVMVFIASSSCSLTNEARWVAGVAA